MKKTYKIPFNKNGEVPHFPIGDVTWEDNYVFSTSLKFHEFRRGRSAAYATFIDSSNGKVHNVFLIDFTDMVPYLNEGVISGNFTFAKRGQNYGVKIHKES